MPEGHTLHRLAGGLTANFAGRSVEASSPQARFAASAAQVDGTVLVGAEAWGKHLFLEFADDRFVHIHLGLYGRLDLHAVVPAVPEPVGQVRLRLVAATGTAGGGSTTFSYADLRGATACELLTRAEREAIVARSGPDPLRAGADPGLAWDRIRRSRAPIAGLLMDQGVLAGVGNVYRAELLFRHRVDPFRPGRTLRAGQWQAMWDDLVALMGEGVRTGRIDTVRPEHLPEAMGRPPRRDDHGGEVYVYRRNGQPCHVCGRVVRTTELQGRNLFWCGQCQRKYRSRAVRALQ